MSGLSTGLLLARFRLFKQTFEFKLEEIAPSVNAFVGRTQTPSPHNARAQPQQAQSKSDRRSSFRSSCGRGQASAPAPADEKETAGGKLDGRHPRQNFAGGRDFVCRGRF